MSPQWPIIIIVLLATASLTQGQGKCDQTPPGVDVEPSEEKGIYHLQIQNAETADCKRCYTPAQTYVLTITTSVANRPFKWFMITAEDPAVDNRIYDFGNKYQTDVGVLKTLDTDRQSRYSERCSSTVESADKSDKTSIEIHWVSPKPSKSTPKDQKVRIRATVAENNEAWYEGENLTIVLTRNSKRAIDSPPINPTKKCNLCSEARYEVIFNGKWSRMAHPRHYPSKPDENGYSHMVGASHDYNYSLWQRGFKASPGLKQLVEDSNTTVIEDEIISMMDEKKGTRTLIRGRRRHHPFMSEPSHSLFRVDRYHHLFSIVVGMRPSPDWFLGTSRFELCTKDGWLLEHSLPLYPWDAGTVDGVSYESPKTVRNPEDNIDRVEVGSFNRASPFYQMNLNDLKPFAILIVRRLDVFPLINADCSDEGEEPEEGGEPQPVEGEPAEEEEVQDEPEEPMVSELRPNLEGVNKCYLSEWGAWSPCTPADGACGSGFMTRARYRGDRSIYFDSYKYQDNQQAQPTSGNCEGDQDAKLVEYQNCFVDC